MIRDYIKDDEIISIVKDLIELDTHKEEEQAANYIKAIFEKEGITSHLDEVVEKRPNIYGKIEGKSHVNALMLNGHTDVVPGDNMDYEPFKPFVKDGNIYGRGSADMKGGLAAMIGALIATKRSDIKLEKGLLFSGVIDEERQSQGTGKLLKEGLSAEKVVVGEPTQLKAVIAHKGVEEIKITFRGKSGHASIPNKSINAICIAAEFIRLVGEEIEPVIKDNKFNLLDSGSISVSVIKGGTVANVVPDECSVVLDRRLLPNENVESCLKEIEIIAKKSTEKFGGNYSVERIQLSSTGNMPFYINEKSSYVKEVLEIINEFGVDQKPIGFSGWTEAALFENLGNMDCIVLGPGNVKQAHANNEYCDINEIIKATHIYIELIKKYCLGGKNHETK